MYGGGEEWIRESEGNDQKVVEGTIEGCKSAEKKDSQNQ